MALALMIIAMLIGTGMLLSNGTHDPQWHADKEKEKWKS